MHNALGRVSLSSSLYIFLIYWVWGMKKALCSMHLIIVHLSRLHCSPYFLFPNEGKGCT